MDAYTIQWVKAQNTVAAAYNAATTAARNNLAVAQARNATQFSMDAVTAQKVRDLAELLDEQQARGQQRGVDFAHRLSRSAADGTQRLDQATAQHSWAEDVARDEQWNQIELYDPNSRPTGLATEDEATQARDDASQAAIASWRSSAAGADRVYLDDSAEITRTLTIDHAASTKQYEVQLAQARSAWMMANLDHPTAYDTLDYHRALRDAEFSRTVSLASAEADWQQHLLQADYAGWSKLHQELPTPWTAFQVDAAQARQLAFSSLDYIGFQTNLANDEVAYQNAFIGALDILGTAQATAEPSRVSNLAEVTRMHDVSQAYAQEGLAGLFSQEYETFQNSDDAASYTNSMHTQLDEYFSAFNDSEKQHIQDRANAEVLETQAAAGVFEQQFDTTLNEQLRLKHDNQTQHRTQYQLTSSANWLNQVSSSSFTATSPWHQHLYETTLADDAFAQDETTARLILDAAENLAERDYQDAVATGRAQLAVDRLTESAAEDIAAYKDVTRESLYGPDPVEAPERLQVQTRRDEPTNGDWSLYTGEGGWSDVPWDQAGYDSLAATR